MLSSELTVQRKIGGSAKTNPLDQRIEQDQSTRSTLQPEGLKQTSATVEVRFPSGPSVNRT